MPCNKRRVDQPGGAPFGPVGLGCTSNRAAADFPFTETAGPCCISLAHKRMFVHIHFVCTYAERGSHLPHASIGPSDAAGVHILMLNNQEIEDNLLPSAHPPCRDVVRQPHLSQLNTQIRKGLTTSSISFRDCTSPAVPLKSIDGEVASWLTITKPLKGSNWVHITCPVVHDPIHR